MAELETIPKDIAYDPRPKADKLAELIAGNAEQWEVEATFLAYVITLGEGSLARAEEHMADLKGLLAVFNEYKAEQLRAIETEEDE